MRALLHAVMSEHRRLRDYLRGMLLLLARAQEGDVNAWHQLTQLDVKRELEIHARRERNEIERVFASPDPFGTNQRRKLDALHQIEARAAILVRVAPDLEDAILHIGEIVEALAEEERDLMAAQELLEGPAAASKHLAEALAEEREP